MCTVQKPYISSNATTFREEKIITKQVQEDHCYVLLNGVIQNAISVSLTRSRIYFICHLSPYHVHFFLSYVNKLFDHNTPRG